MAIDLLKDIQVKNAKSQEKDYFLNDGAGLRLKVTKDNRKIWEFRFTFQGKRRVTTFKTYPIVSLKEARNKRTEYLNIINQGINPIDFFNNVQNEIIIDEKGIFLNVVKEWLEEEGKRVKDNTHLTKVRIFENDINPFLKNKHIKDVTKEDVLKIIKTKEIQAPNVASNIYFCKKFI